jgi:putative addiction module component (TIGR02574 family)
MHNRGTGMNLQEIEREALHLSEEERAELAQKLLLSLDTPTEAEIAEDWLGEADRRARELDAGLVEAIPAEEVRRKAMSLLR